MGTRILTSDEEKKYLNCSHKCMICGSEDISGGFIEINEAGAWQEVRCNDCGAVWNDTYTLTGVDLLDDGNERRMSNGQ